MIEHVHHYTAISFHQGRLYVISFDIGALRAQEFLFSVLVLEVGRHFPGTFKVHTHPNVVLVPLVCQ